MWKLKEWVEFTHGLIIGGVSVIIMLTVIKTFPGYEIGIFILALCLYLVWVWRSYLEGFK